jgi:hypothetical protein
MVLLIQASICCSASGAVDPSKHLSVLQGAVLIVLLIQASIYLCCSDNGAVDPSKHLSVLQC